MPSQAEPTPAEKAEIARRVIEAEQRFDEFVKEARWRAELNTISNSTPVPLPVVFSGLDRALAEVREFAKRGVAYELEYSSFIFKATAGRSAYAQVGIIVTHTAEPAASAPEVCARTKRGNVPTHTNAASRKKGAPTRMKPRIQPILAGFSTSN